MEARRRADGRGIHLRVSSPLKILRDPYACERDADVDIRIVARTGHLGKCQKRCARPSNMLVCHAETWMRTRQSDTFSRWRLSVDGRRNVGANLLRCSDLDKSRIANLDNYHTVGAGQSVFMIIHRRPISDVECGKSSGSIIVRIYDTVRMCDV